MSRVGIDPSAVETVTLTFKALSNGYHVLSPDKRSLGFVQEIPDEIEMALVIFGCQDFLDDKDGEHVYLYARKD